MNNKKGVCNIKSSHVKYVEGSQWQKTKHTEGPFCHSRIKVGIITNTNILDINKPTYLTSKHEYFTAT